MSRAARQGELNRVSFAFARYGEVLEPRSGVVAVDVGSTCVAGVIDHHFAEAGDECAATLVVNRGQELVLQHLRDAPADPLTIVMHQQPDLDCIVAAYLVMELVSHGALPPGAPALAEYARVIERGTLPPDGLGPTSLWALYTATTHLLSQTEDRPEEQADLFRQWVARGLELLDYAIEGEPADAAEIWLPEELPGWSREQAFLDEEQERYSADRRSAEEITLTVPTPEQDATVTVPGVRIESPRSALFRQFAQAEGFPLVQIITDRSVDGPPPLTGQRHIITLAPESGGWLRGLGAALERREVEARAELGALRPPPPRWPDVTNSDPWYDGRSPLHGYSLVDTPHGGTVLSAEELSAIIADSPAWMVLGQPARERLCPKGCRLPEGSGAAYCPYHADKLMPSRVDGRYEVEEILAEGGMGSVWRVRDARTARRYALKRLLPQMMGNEEIWNRFRREAAVASRVAHPNVVRLITSGTSAEAGPYFVSELIDGSDLRQDMLAFQQRREWYPWPRLRSVILQVCYALDAVHGSGVLHRDLKPENIMLVGEEPGDDNPWPPIKVLDFGLSIYTDPSAPRFTVGSMASGTAEYASPEQLGVMRLDERSDLYALGSILFELLSYETPFSELSNPMEIGMAKVSREPPELPGDHPQRALTPELEALVARLLAREPDQRPSSAAEVIAALDQIPPD